MKTETKRILEKAQAGDAEAQYLTGLYYEDKGNADEAFLWYDRSATQGFVYGINAVAIYYLKGMAVKHDTGKAIALLESIADKFPTAKANLGHIYLEGQGCPQDIGKGIGLLGQAARTVGFHNGAYTPQRAVWDSRNVQGSDRMVREGL